MKTFVLVSCMDTGAEYEPLVQVSGVAESIEDILQRWVIPTHGYVPDHVENIVDDFDRTVTYDVLKAESIRRTKERFGIGVKRNNDYSHEWRIIEVDLDTGKVVVYGDTEAYSQVPDDREVDENFE